MQSVKLDPEGRNESKSGVLLIDAELKDIARIDRFLEQTTFVDHALVFQEGFTLGKIPHVRPFEWFSTDAVKRWQPDWPINARDRKFGEGRPRLHGLSTRGLRPNDYVSTGIVSTGAKQRCKMIAEGGDRTTWEVSLKDGETGCPNRDLGGRERRRSDQKNRARK